ncbi:MAG TPA: universal stress protein [Trebonia sp.]|nr:universal stress protein [Trebonia sp.]
MTTHPSSESSHRIVVGVDGSPSSRAALAWAVRQARLTGATVEAVIAWEYRAGLAYPAPVPVPAPAPPEADWAVPATEVLNRAIAAVPNEGAAVTINPTVTEGHAARVLLDASKDADLLVVGNRGYGGFVEAVIGSVSQHCVHHATCPVVIVRDTATA